SSATGMPASASRRNPMICSSVKRFFMSNLPVMVDWTLKSRATQYRGDVGLMTIGLIIVKPIVINRNDNAFTDS
ncbi:hypothetical protein LH460_14610, partial [Laribacter hongkongensis]|uniref:hypothetical protein n=1 Tax=Laribacter hongkongensis TaxID=168471 RepID=UPI001EFC50D4